MSTWTGMKSGSGTRRNPAARPCGWKGPAGPRRSGRPAAGARPAPPALSGRQWAGRLWAPAPGLSLGATPEGEPLADRPAALFRPDGKAFATPVFEHAARLWDADTGRPAGPPLEHPKVVIAYAFGPDGKTLLTCCEGTDRTLRRWDPATGKLLGSQTLYQGEENWSASFSPDGRTLLTRERDHARLWDAATGKPVGRPLRGLGETLLWFERSVEVFSPNGRLVLTAGPDASARLWHVATGEPFGAPLKPSGPVHATAFRADGKVVLLGGEDESGQRGEARLWETATGQPVGPPLTHRRSVTAVAFSPDGRAVLTGSRDGTARLWDAATGKPLYPPLAPPGPALIVAFSPDGKPALTATGSLPATQGLTAPPWHAA